MFHFNCFIGRENKKSEPGLLTYSNQEQSGIKKIIVSRSKILESVNCACLTPHPYCYHFTACYYRVGTVPSRSFYDNTDM